MNLQEEKPCVVIMAFNILTVIILIHCVAPFVNGTCRQSFCSFLLLLLVMVLCPSYLFVDWHHSRL